VKQMYWRPRKVSGWAVGLVAVVAVLGGAAVELFQTREHQPDYERKLAAARLARQCQEAIRAERLRRGYPIDPKLDPGGTGLVGTTMSPITSITGHRASKQTATNPNFAAVVVDMFRQAGLEEGDRVAVGYSGSFPGGNIAVCAAIETLELRPTIVASVGSSQYGANLPEFIWLDMERLIHEQGLISFRSAAASLGGREDRGLGMDRKTREEIRGKIRDHGLPLIEGKNFADSFQKRMDVYQKHANGAPVKAYVNVGGGAVSVGRSFGKRFYNDGLNLEQPEEAAELDGVMAQFAGQGAAVIHLVGYQGLARQYGLPVAPKRIPEIGQGGVFVRRHYNRLLAGGVLVVLVVLARWAVFGDLGPRIESLVDRFRRRLPRAFHAKLHAELASEDAEEQHPLELMV